MGCSNMHSRDENKITVTITEASLMPQQHQVLLHLLLLIITEDELNKALARV